MYDAAGTVFYVSNNYSRLVRSRRPWWQQVFYHGKSDRDDKIVDWVIRHYSPGDGLARFPMRIHRNVWNAPQVTISFLEFVLADAVRLQLQALDTPCEFLEVVFERLYEIPWGGSIARPLSDNADDDEIEMLSQRSEFSAASMPGRYFELIAPITERCTPQAGRPRLHIEGPLSLTRTVELKSSINVDLDEATFDRFEMLYHGGAGLLCTARAATIFRDAIDSDWFAIEAIPYQRINDN